MTLYQNIPGASGYFCGKYLNDYNQYLEQPRASSYFPTSSWFSIENTYFTLSNTELYDHIHFQQTSSSTPPAPSSFSSSGYGTGSSLSVPMSEGIRYVHLIEHNCLHQWHGGSDDVRTLGPFWIDNSAPFGSISIASGILRLDLPETFLKVTGQDTYSGISGIYIDGDVLSGPNVRQWIPYESLINIELSHANERKVVNLRFVDFVGNESSLFVDDIFLGAKRYYFLPTKTNPPMLSPDIHSFSNQNVSMKTNIPSMNQGNENGILHGS